MTPSTQTTWWLNEGQRGLIKTAVAVARLDQSEDRHEPGIIMSAGHPAIELDLTPERVVELRQNLVALGYLGVEHAAFDQAVDIAISADLLDGAATFLAEIKTCSDTILLSGLSLAGKEPVRASDAKFQVTGRSGFPLPQTDGQYDSVEWVFIIEALARLAALDGYVGHAGRFNFGQRGIEVRLLRYRLASYQVGSGRRNQPFGKDDMLALRALMQHLADFGPEASDLEVDDAGVELSASLIADLGDARRMLARFARRLDEHPLVYRDVTTKGYDADPYHQLRVVDGRFTTTCMSVFPWDDCTVSHVGEANRPAAADRARSVLNQTGLELLQAALASAGFYGGRLDGVWGEQSHAGLRAAVGFHGRTLRDFVRFLGDGHWAVNLPKLIKDIFGAQAPTDADNARHLDYMAREIKDEDWNRNTDAEGALKVREQLMDAARAGRRLFQGMRSMLRSAVDFLWKRVRGLWNWLTGAVRPMQDYFKLVIRGAREGLRAFLRGIDLMGRYIFGLPIYSIGTSGLPSVVSIFSADRDAALWITATASLDTIRDHMRMIDRQTRAFAVFCRATAGFVNLASMIASGPIGWARASIYLLRHLFMASKLNET
jgi:uncharacterized protein (DUF2267 family)